MKNIDIKNYLTTKLKIVGFIFALVGWFILFIFIFGQLFQQQLVVLEEIIESKFFIWGLRIFIISFIVILIKGKKFVHILTSNKKVNFLIRIIFLGGAVGWIWWIISIRF